MKGELIMKHLIAILLFFSSFALWSCPSIGASGTSLIYDSQELYSPKRHDVIAGGGENLSDCYDLPGTGWVAYSPDFELDFEQLKPVRELEMRVDSDCDSVLLVNGPAGNWFHDDDSNGSLDPKIRFTNAPNGIYDIWIGTYDGEYCDAVLTLETF